MAGAATLVPWPIVNVVFVCLTTFTVDRVQILLAAVPTGSPVPCSWTATIWPSMAGTAMSRPVSKIKLILVMAPWYVMIRIMASNSGVPPGGASPSARPRAAKDKNERLLPYVQQFARAFHLGCGPDQAPYYYSNGVYVPNAEGMASRWLLSQLQASSTDQALWSPTAEGHLTSYVCTAASFRELTGSAMGWINCLNCVLGVQGLKPDAVPPDLRDDNRLYAHSHTLATYTQLPVHYDPAADCPALRRFQEMVLPDGPADFLAEVAAWCLQPVNPAQKALLLFGPKGNGKSTFLRVLQHFVGAANYSVDSLHSLTGNRFALEQVHGKVAHFCADLPKDELPGMDVFKQLAGDDTISAERKYKARFHFRASAKLIFSSNGPPQSPGADGAFWRRWHIVPLRQNLMGRDRRIMDEIIAEMTTPAELSGLLNWALQVGPRVWSQGLTETDEHKEIVSMCAHFQDVVDHFVSEATYNSPGMAVNVRDLPSRFYLWARERGVVTKGYGTHDLVGALERAGGKWAGTIIRDIGWVNDRPNLLNVEDLIQ
jgi:P4 family phage/plasmid primase-like protien